MAIAAAAVRVPKEAARGTSAALSSFGWLIVAQMTFGGGTFAVAIMRARYFSLEDFATYALAATFVAFFSVIADFGLPTMMIRDLARRETDVRGYLGASLSVTMSMALVAAAGVLATSFLFAHGSKLNVIAAVLALNLLASGISMTPIAYLRATGRARYEAIARITTATATIGLSGLAITLNGGIVSFAWATFGATVAGTVITMLATCAGAGAVLPRIDARHTRALLVDSAPLGLGMVFTAIYYYSDSLMLGAFGQHEALARYNAAYVFVLAASLFIGAMRNAFLPAQSRAFQPQGTDRPVLRTYFRITIGLAVAACILGPLLAQPLLRIAYGASYTSGAPALRILFLTTGVMFFSSYYGSNLLMAGRQRLYLAATTGGAILNVAACLVAIPLFSLVGAASATLATEVAVCMYLAAADRDLHR